MVGVRQDGKIFNAIIHRVTIDMMNMFPGFKLSTKMNFHQISMDAHFLAISKGHCFISMVWLIRCLKSIVGTILRKVVFSKTGPGAIFNISSQYSIPWGVKLFATYLAQKRSSFFRSWHGFMGLNITKLMRMFHATRPRAIGLSSKPWVEFRRTISAFINFGLNPPCHGVHYNSML